MILVLNATHGFHIRNLFDSGLVARLSREFRVVALTSAADAELLRQEYGSLVEVRAISASTHWLESKLEFVRKRILVKPDRAVTTSVFSEQEKRDRPLRYWSLTVLNRILGRSRLLRELWLRFEAVLIPGDEFNVALREISPAVIVTANYGTEPGTIRLLRAARRMRIPSVAVVPSFDNLTSKGVIGARPERLAVWNDTMAREAEQLHDFPSHRVSVCGAVQFDVYTRPDEWPSPESIWRQVGLDPNRPTIVMGTITPAYFPHNVEVVELLAEAIAAAELPPHCQILVRLHPQVVDGGQYGDDLSQYRNLVARYPFIGLDVPATRAWASMQPPARDDMLRLATILSHSVALVVPASTLALDAAAVDTPIVGLGFDGRAGRIAVGSIERMFYFTHYRPITESGAIHLARSPGEMIEAIRSAMENRATRAVERRQLAAAIMGPRDGCAVDRVALAVRDTARATVVS